MTELTDPDGPWSKEMVEIMLAEVDAVDARKRGDFYESTLAAIGSAFSKGSVGKTYARSLQKVIDGVKDGRRRARGLAQEHRPNPDAETVRKAFGGMMPPRRKGKK